MDVRSFFLVVVVLGAGAVASSVACSGPDPGAITFSERLGTGGTDPGSGSSSGSSGTSSGGTSSSGSTDGGGGGGGVDPIFGTSTFAYQDPGQTANNVASHGGSVEGKDCIVAGCHLDNNKKWAFAGTVYTDAKGTTTVPKAEVRVVKPDGTEYGHAYTDANGNFWLDNASPFPEGSKVGVRREGGKPANMVAVLKANEKGCNAGGTCHGGAQGKVYAP